MTADEQTIEALQQQLREAQESSRQMLLRAQGAEAREEALAAHVERMRVATPALEGASACGSPESVLIRYA